MEERVGNKINSLSYKLKREFRNLSAIQKIDRISSTNGAFLVYIYESKEPVYQKDIEKHFGITRSTASKIISLMETKNLIKRVSVNNDLRLKQLILTEDAIKLSKEVINDINEFESKLDLALGDKKDEFISMLELLDKTLDGGNKND